jgi:hypothetical protein
MDISNLGKGALVGKKKVNKKAIRVKSKHKIKIYYR